MKLTRFLWTHLLVWAVLPVSLAVAGEPRVIRLWPSEMPGPPPKTTGDEADQQKPTDRLVGGQTVMKLGNVSQPEIHIYPAPPELNTKTACLICPGGGFSILAWDLEGQETAQWCNRMGVTGIVLKYRVPTRDHGYPGKWEGPVMDAQRALSVTRAHAQEWNIDPDRIGVLGFSAGGEVASIVAIKGGQRLYSPQDDLDQLGCQANFGLLIYAGGIVDDKAQLRDTFLVDEKTPPLFFAHAADDRVKAQSATELFNALNLAKVPSEVHVYRDGGHGYGARPDWSRVTCWPRDAEGFLHELGLLTPATKLAFETSDKRSGSPTDFLPPYVRQLTQFGERPDWSHDGQRIVFVEKPLGEVFEYELASGSIRPLTMHFKHYGFTRAMYLVNGDVLLAGPNQAYDIAHPQERDRARDLCWLSVLKPDQKSQPIPLNTLCAEGPAVSRNSMNIAWTIRDRQNPNLGVNRAQIFAGEIVEDQPGKPTLTNQRLVFDSKQLPFELGKSSLETQNFVPPDDRQLTISVYQISEGSNTETFLVHTQTGEFQNMTRTSDRYEEPEGIFPDGKSTLVEHALSAGNDFPLPDLYQLKLDGSGKMRRLTSFNDFKGFKGTQGVVSDDGRFLCYQIGKTADEAGAGYGLFLMNLTQAESYFSDEATHASDGLPEEKVADLFLERWNNHQPLPQFSTLELLKNRHTLADAYSLQRSWVLRSLDEAGLGGVKGGVILKGSQKSFGVSEPVGALLRASGQFEASDEPVLNLDQWPGLKIETEIGLVIGKNIDRTLDDVDDLKAHVSAIIPAIEFPAGLRETKGETTVADLAAVNVSAAAYIVGQPIDPDSIDPRQIQITFTKDGTELHRASGSDCWTGPWETALWLANFAHQQGVTLQPGQVIFCGAIGKIQPGEPGHYEADYGPSGKIRFTLK